jgi:hypothetical protein
MKARTMMSSIADPHMMQMNGSIVKDICVANERAATVRIAVSRTTNVDTVAMASIIHEKVSSRDGKA